MDTPSQSLRPATLEDMERVLRIEQAVHTAPWVKEHFEAELIKPYSHFWVLTDDATDTEISGYVVSWLMFDECQILNVAVDLPFRGLGLGKFMVRKVIQLAVKKGMKRVVLEVRKNNTPAIQLYQSLGFDITHIRKEFYSDGEDAYQMAIGLTGEFIEF